MCKTVLETILINIRLYCICKRLSGYTWVHSCHVQAICSVSNWVGGDHSSQHSCGVAALGDGLG